MGVFTAPQGQSILGAQMTDGTAEPDYQLGQRTLWALLIPALVAGLFIWLFWRWPGSLDPFSLALAIYFIVLPLIQIGLICLAIRYTHPDIFIYLFVLFWINELLVVLLFYLGFATSNSPPDFNLDRFFQSMNDYSEAGGFMVLSTYTFILTMPTTGILWYVIFKGAIEKKPHAL